MPSWPSTAGSGTSTSPDVSHAGTGPRRGGGWPGPFGRKIPGIAEVASVFVKKRQDGVIIDAGVVIHAGSSMMEAARALQIAIHENIEKMTAMNVLGADISIEDLQWPKTGN